MCLAAFAEVALKPRIVEVASFTVAGIATRTNNAKEAGPEGVIGKQWQRLMGEHLFDKIPHKQSPDVYAVYTDYASDANGDYTYILGAKVEGASGGLPEGMVENTIPAGRYAVFTSARGPVTTVVVDTWKQIWSYFQSDQNGQRAYKADFELHDERAADPSNTQVDIYIGLK